MATVHVIGAGIGGLAAATALAADHVPVKLYEATSVAGGRCRSSASDVGVADHGLHLIPHGSAEIFRFLDRINARERLLPIKQPRFPSASICDYLALIMARWLPGERLLTDMLPEENPLYDTLLTTTARAQLNTPVHALHTRALKHASFRGPFYMAATSLNDTFIEPALHFLEYCGGSTYFGHALTGVGKTEDSVTSLTFSRKKVSVAADDVVILSTPAAFTRSVFPDVTIPDSYHSSITLHYAAEHDEAAGTLCYVTGGPVDAIRYGSGMVSATIRIADGSWHSDQPLLAARIWKYLQKIHPALRGQSLPKWWIWREKHAGHTLQPGTMAISNQPHPRCILAGDWLDASHPASLETAAASGHKAATLAKELVGNRSLRVQ